MQFIHPEVTKQKEARAEKADSSGDTVCNVELKSESGSTNPGYNIEWNLFLQNVTTDLG
jgi:hypothetical protein